MDRVDRARFFVSGGVFLVMVGAVIAWSIGLRSTEGAPAASGMERLPEAPNDPPIPPEILARQAVSARSIITRGPYTSIQVNVNALQQNIVGDAANEPSIAVSPANSNRMVIAWRQFDSIASDFRQAGVGYTQDRGQTWTKFTLDPGQFRSDPVLAADSAGTFFLSSLSTTTSAQVWRSLDGGVNWTMAGAFGGDKQWMVVDARPSGMGAGHVYQNWNVQFSCCPPNDFTRSINGGVSFQSPVAIPTPSMKWGTLAVGSDGTLYLAGSNLGQTGHLFTKSTTARNPGLSPTFSAVQSVNLGGRTAIGGTMNPVGLLGQVWIAADRSAGPTGGNLYIAATVTNNTDVNPTNVRFIRSVDGGTTWSSPALVNDDPTSGAHHWFGTMSVAPSGRIDVIWNDTRNDAGNFLTEVFYSYSLDGGLSWSPNEPLTPAWNPGLGYPVQQKIGDYYHMVSDDGGADLAYAATFNGEQDVYYLRIPRDCNGNGIEDDCDIACGAPGTRCDVAGCGMLGDCNNNKIPDVCEPLADCNNNTVPDICDIGSGASNDCNHNLVPDECESAADCNNNSVPDICDLTSGTSRDCNGNGVPDECDIASMSSADANGNGVPDECEGACCTCTQCFDLDPLGCSGIDGAFSGLGVLCGASGACTPSAPANDVCAQATVLPSLPTTSQPFDNRCATTDGPATVNCPGAQPFGADLWYHYTAPCTGSVTVSLCGATNYDSIMDVYGGTGPVCPCPTTTAGLIVCGDDNCGLGGGPSAVTFSVTAGRCYTIRVGGWNSERGTGVLNLSYNTSCSVLPATPLADPSGVDKCRFVSMSIPSSSVPGNDIVAIRVALVSLHHVNPPYTGGPSVPFTAFEGEVRWVGPPVQYVESTAIPTPFYASHLQCTPHYRDWTTVGVLHVTGSAIVPSSSYEARTLAASCMGNEGSCSAVSGALALRTTRWGDVVAPFNPPDGSVQPDFGDVASLVDKFKSVPGAPIKARALLAGGTINVLPDADFTQIAACVDAFKGLPYPYAVDSCP